MKRKCLKMIQMPRMVILLPAAFIIIGVCGNPIDNQATLGTKQLYNILKTYTNDPNKILFGQHLATEVGVAGGHAPYALMNTSLGTVSWHYSIHQADAKYPDELCDVKSVTGEYPSVIGFDLNELNPGKLHRRSWLIREAADKGLIITVSWHERNPISHGSVYVRNDHSSVNITHPIRRILPGGDHHVDFKLDIVADWLGNLADSQGNKVPVIFRPYHEMSGSWFWWGTDRSLHNTPQDYKELFRYTVNYLRNTKHVHNVLYAYSPGKNGDASKYMHFYPGDRYVDVLGTDFYYSKPFQPGTSTFLANVKFVTDTAHARGKIAALTETGIANNGYNTHPNFWMDHVLKPLKSGNGTTRISYMLTWSNSCGSADNCEVRVPYKGHPAEGMFLTFYRDPMVVFGEHAQHGSATLIG